MTDSGAAALIRHKREGGEYDAGQLTDIARGIADGRWSEGQVGAFAMAVAWRGMGTDECRRFTLALRDSGHRLRWHDLPGPALDKHSTGGVGDAVSLLLAPLVAACGGYVPMISGRGLGHTGGTLDKLQSLHGYDIHPSNERLRTVVRDVGCAIVGQSADLVPADRTLYAVRDVTATVDVRALGQAVVDLGGGRQRPQDEVDPAVGLSGVLGLGERVDVGQPLACVHAPGEVEARRAVDAVRRALDIGEGEVALPALYAWHEAAGEGE